MKSHVAYGETPCIYLKGKKDVLLMAARAKWRGFLKFIETYVTEYLLSDMIDVGIALGI